MVYCIYKLLLTSYKESVCKIQRNWLLNFSTRKKSQNIESPNVVGLVGHLYNFGIRAYLQLMKIIKLRWRKFIMNRRYNFYKQILHNHFGHRCCYCGVGDNLHIHHIRPTVLGGTDDLSNLELVCDKCHYDLHRQLRKIMPYKGKKIHAIDVYVKWFGFKKSQRKLNAA